MPNSVTVTLRPEIDPNSDQFPVALDVSLGLVKFVAIPALDTASRHHPRVLSRRRTASALSSSLSGSRSIMSMAVSRSLGSAAPACVS